jgi:hypothetical protein
LAMMRALPGELGRRLKWAGRLPVPPEGRLARGALVCESDEAALVPQPPTTLARHHHSRWDEGAHLPRPNRKDGDKSHRPREGSDLPRAARRFPL